MNKLFFSVILMLFSASFAFAQVDTTRLFYAKKIESNAFAELGSSIIHVNKHAGLDVDFSVNWLYKHKYLLGAAYNQLASSESFSSYSLIDSSIATQINYQSVGLRGGYVFFHDNKIISLSPDLTVGWTSLKLRYPDDSQIKKNIAFISPAVKAVFNVSSYFRIGVQLNYRNYIFKDINESNTETGISTQFQSKNISGIGGGIFLRIGTF